MGRRKRVTEGKRFVGPLDGAHTIYSANPLSRKALTGRMPKQQDRQVYSERQQIEHIGEVGITTVERDNVAFRGQGKVFPSEA